MELSDEQRRLLHAVRDVEAASGVPHTIALGRQADLGEDEVPAVAQQLVAAGLLEEHKQTDADLEAEWLATRRYRLTEAGRAALAT